MPAALLDTNMISDLMRDHVRVKGRLATHSDSVVTSAIVVGEIRYGLSRLPVGKKRAALDSRAQGILSAFQVEPVNPLVAESYGRLKANLESQGLNLNDNDVWIAATALALGHLLITRDQVFSQIPGLLVEDWSV